METENSASDLLINLSSSYAKLLANFKEMKVETYLLDSIGKILKVLSFNLNSL